MLILLPRMKIPVWVQHNNLNYWTDVSSQFWEDSPDFCHETHFRGHKRVLLLCTWQLYNERSDRFQDMTGPKVQWHKRDIYFFKAVHWMKSSCSLDVSRKSLQNVQVNIRSPGRCLQSVMLATGFELSDDKDQCQDSMWISLYLIENLVCIRELHFFSAFNFGAHTSLLHWKYLDG